MPVLANAKKALRRDRRRTVINKRVKDLMKSAVKEARETKLESNLPKAFQKIDRAAKRNLIHKKKAARLKSQLSKLVVRDTTKVTVSTKKTAAKKTTTKKTTKAKTA